MPRRRKRADRPVRTPASSSGATRSSTSWPKAARRCPATSTPRADFEAAKDEEVKLVSQATPRWVAPHFVWAVRDELALRLCGEGVSTCDALEAGGLQGDHDPRHRPPARGGEMGPRRGDRAACAGPAGERREPRVRGGPAVDGEPARQALAQRRARGPRLPDGRARGVRRERKLLLELHQARVPAAVRRSGRRVPPAGFSVQAVQLRGRHRGPRSDRGHDADGRRHGFRRRLHARAMPTCSSAAPSGFATRSSSRSTSRRSRRWP